MTVDALELAPRIDHLLLSTGDADLFELVLALQRRGVRVTYLSTLEGCSDDLRRQCDSFVDLKTIRAIIERKDYDPAKTAERREKFIERETPASEKFSVSLER